MRRGSDSACAGADTDAMCPRVELTRRLTLQVFVAHLEPAGTGADTHITTNANAFHRTVAVKQRELQRESDRGGCRGLRAWQEWRTVHRLLALERAYQSNRSQRDAVTLAGRRHVVRYYATTVESESFRLIMEFCPRRDLLSHLLARGDASASVDAPKDTLPRVSQQEARRWVLQLARGLRYLHANGIAHRDLCLENILLSAAGECKICNFGASTTRAGAPTRERVSGNLLYTAPEAVSGGWYDPIRADVWSLGAVFFVLLTGSPLLRLPFPDCRGFELVRTVGCRGVLKLWGMAHLFSAATLDLLARMLAVDPARRLRDMRGVLEHPAMLAAARSEGSLTAL